MSRYSAGTLQAGPGIHNDGMLSRHIQSTLLKPVSSQAALERVAAVVFASVVGRRHRHLCVSHFYS